MKLESVGASLDLSTPVVMGVLNVTPDSFSDGGVFNKPQLAIDHALRMEDAGARLIDVGGESTRPGAQPVTPEQELARVMPVLEALSGRLSCWLSIDTSNPEVITAAASVGVKLINDVRALRRDGALQAAANTGCAICLMHMQGEPGTMQQSPSYAQVVSDVHGFLQERLDACEQAGITRSRVVIDPGFGFGKRLEHNLALLGNLAHFSSLGCGVLVGMSRKSMLGAMLNKPVDGRLAGSLALALLAAQRGAHIIRVHDVAETVDVLTVLNHVESMQPLHLS